jgi:hypothetical protein
MKSRVSISLLPYEPCLRTDWWPIFDSEACVLKNHPFAFSPGRAGLIKSVHIKSSESPRGSKFQTSATRFESYFSSLFVLRTLRNSCKEQTRCRTETLPLRPLVPRLSDESLEKIRQDLPRPEYGHKACFVSTRKLQRFLRSSNSIFQVLPARIAPAQLRPGRSPHFCPPSRSLAALGNSSSTWTNRRQFFF